MEYNKEQLALINAPIDEIVIGASSAGSGKSTTLVGRAMRILKSYPSGQVMLISFTRNSAEDLRNKLKKTLSEDDMRRVITGTYHSIMSRFIRAKAVEVGLNPNFSIVDESSTLMLYRRLIEDATEYTELYKDWVSDEIDSDKPLGKKEFNRIANTLSLLINNAHPSNLLTGEFDDDVYDRLKLQDYKFAVLPRHKQVEVVKSLYKLFQQSIIHSRETNVITYDLILFISYLMGENGLLDSFSKTIVHTIVDEFQDSNYLQDAWVRQIAGNKLTLIGDVDQSIYAFRGGRPQIMDEYTKKYKVYNLSNNYRSLQEILDVGNTVIASNEEGKTSRKPMVAFRPTQNSNAIQGIQWYHTNNDSEEARHIVSVIEALHKNGLPYEDMAILVRSRMALPILNQQLQLANIPLHDTTKFADFMKSEVMVDMMNFLKIFTNPKDIYAFMATLDRPKRGIGPVALNKLEMSAKKCDQSLVEFILSDNVNTLTPALKKKVVDYSTVYNELLSHNKDMSLQEAVDFLLHKTGYLAWINGLKNNERYLRHVDMLHQVVDEYANQYAEEQGDKEWTLFDIASNFTFDMAGAVKEETPEGLTISTIHGSKGLEWKVVIIVGVENGVFPMRNNTAELEDERRLMYVATTRAKDALLYYTTDKRVTVQKDLEPSFLMDETQLKPRRI